MKTAFAAVAGLLSALAVAAPAAASSLPRVDFGTEPILGLGLGANQGLSVGGSLSLDVPLGTRWMAGASVGSSLARSITYDVRAVYRLVDGGPETPAIGVIVGLWGAPGAPGFQLPGGVAPLVGFGLGYSINDQFDVRLNLSYSPFFNYGSGEFLTFIGGPPLAGLEVGYRLAPGLEATLGINGRGDFVGLAYTF